ncbi:transporter [Chromatiales bacterium (ex Bugula neritina AB1)]|nr:transporter [Chromatiales bacterium (ex Bugula neritina AB1)]
MTKFIPLILFTVLTNFLSQIMLKKGMTQISIGSLNSNNIFNAIPSIILNVFVLGGLFVMVVSMASHLLVLSKVDISFAYPFLGLSFVLVTLWGHLVLSEPLSLYKVAGVTFIVLGVALVAKS